MNKETKQKIKLGREKYLDEKVGLVCRIGNDIKIYVDAYQYILKVGSSFKNTYYFASIDEVMEELMDMKAKGLMLQKAEKNIESVYQSIIEAREWQTEVLKPLFSVKNDRKS